MQFSPLVFVLAQSQNLCHTQTDRHFVKIVKSCSRHSKMCKSIKNRMSKIFTIKIVSYIKYGRKQETTIAKRNEITHEAAC